MMERFFTFFQTYRSGILFFLVCLGSLALLVQWFAWIFGLGRFGSGAAETGTGTGTGSGPQQTSLRKLFSGAFVKIVNDFRHLLALVIIGVFAIALGFSLWKAASLTATDDPASVINNMKEALQAVVATLGGLVGSIIGYYFGESTAVKTSDTRPATTDIGGPEVQQASPIREAPPPPVPGPAPVGGSLASDE